MIADGTDAIDAAALRAMGSRLREDGDAEGAIAAFRRAIEARHPEQSPMAAIELGYLFRGRGDLADAAVCFIRAREFGHPDWTPCADVDLGVTLGFANNLPAAIEAFQRAIDAAHQDQTPRAWKELGFQCAQHGFPDRAADAYRRAVASRHPKFAPEAAGYLAELPQPTVEPEEPLDLGTRISNWILERPRTFEPGRDYGWQPDPDHGHATRMWDGKRCLITVTAQTLVLRNDLVLFENITGVAYRETHVATTHRVNGVRTGVTRHTDRTFLVVDGKGTHKIDLGDKASRVGKFFSPQTSLIAGMAWGGLVTLSQQTIEPHLCAGALMALRTGGTFEVHWPKFCRIVLSARGFEVCPTKREAREYAWGQLVDTRLEKGGVFAHARVPGQSEPSQCFGIPMNVPNAVLLPTLMRARARERAA